jgi:hypothetical protein
MRYLPVEKASVAAAILKFQEGKAEIEKIIRYSHHISAVQNERLERQD